MSLFSDVDIVNALKWERLNLEPYDETQLQPCSYDVRLDNRFLVFTDAIAPRPYAHIDPKSEPRMHEVVVADGEAFTLYPGQFALGSTQETITLSSSVAARYEGKSSIGRLGLLTHVTAAFVDAGFQGRITLELSNLSGLPIRLWPGMRIGQLCFFDLLTPSRRPYGAAGNHYQGQRGPTPSRSHLQFKEKVA